MRLIELAMIVLLVYLIYKQRRFTKEMRRKMANQESRLQAISTKIDEVLALLATLKENNPALEDEITEIEGKLAGANPPAELPV